jgi:hypothetical protein
MEFCEINSLCYFDAKVLPPWRRGIVVIVSTNRTEDRGFESRQGVFRTLYVHGKAVLCNIIHIVILCTWVSEINDKIFFNVVILFYVVL